MSTRRKRNLLDATLNTSSAAICVLDEERRIRFFSAGMVTLTGWTADQLEGLACDSGTSPTATAEELFTSALAPSPEVLNGQPQTVHLVLPQRDRGGQRCALSFLPVCDENGAVTRILVLCSGVLPQPRNPTPSLTQRLHAEITTLRSEYRRRFSEQSFFGDCLSVRKALKQAELLVQSDCGFSITGPSGSGRRHLARLIHVAGQQHEESLVALDCRLLLAEQILDALRWMKQSASESKGTPHQRIGTLMLIDADRCPREVQKWILKDMKVEGVRIVAISQESLTAPENDEWILPEFRDLFSTMQIDLPPLHHRGDDISLLAQQFIEDCGRTLETSAEGMTDEVEREFRFYRWPGNVRELRQTIFEACQNSFSDKLTIDDLPFAFRAGLDAQQLNRVPDAKVQSLEDLMIRFESDVLLQTLTACDGNKAEAARRLGMTRPRLYRRLKTLKIDDGYD